MTAEQLAISPHAFESAPYPTTKISLKTILIVKLVVSNPVATAIILESSLSNYHIKSSNFWGCRLSCAATGRWGTEPGQPDRFLSPS